MRKLKTISCVILAATLAGCAATPRTYDQDQSRALNLARAGGIYDQDLRDSPDGTTSYRRSLIGRALDITRLATSLDAPLRHLSGVQTLAFNATDIMSTPDKPSARPSLIGWMPKSVASDENQAYEKYVEAVDTAIEAVAGDMSLAASKLNDVKVPEIDGRPLMLWSIESEHYGCGAGECIIAYNIRQPYEWKTPAFVHGGELESYNIPANHPEKYSRFIFRQSGDTADFPMDEFYRAISEELPPWMVMYFPPNTVFQEGSAISYPVIYEQGNQLMFKDPDA
jgi:hypothetical protein